MSYKFTTGSVRKGDVYYEDDRAGEPTYIDFGQDTITLRPSGSQILFAQADAVGIGTTSPDYTLDVAGDIGVDQYIYHNGDADTLIRFTDDKIVLKAGNKAMVTMEEKSSSPHEVTINDGSNNIDFVVKGNGSGEGNPGMKFDASTNKLGINGVGTPDEALHVDGNIKVVGNDPRIKIDGDTNSHPGLELYENGTRKWIVFNDYTNDNLTFKTNSNIRMSIEQDGNVGIGTTAPDSTLHVHADSIGQGAVTISQADNSTDASQLDLSKSRGTGASPSAVQGNDFVGQVRFLAYDGNSYDNFADIYAQAVGTISTTSHPTKIVIRTTRSSATSPTTAVTIDELQNLRTEGNIESNNSITIRNDNTPSSASDFGVKGEIRYDSNYIYVCVATDTWKRVALSSW
jgi:hypothetical protein